WCGGELHQGGQENDVDAVVRDEPVEEAQAPQERQCDEPEPAEIESTIELVTGRGEDVALLRPEEELEVSFPLRRWNVETRDRQVVGHGQPGGGIPLGRYGERREVLGTEACPDRGRDLPRLGQPVAGLLS